MFIIIRFIIFLNLIKIHHRVELGGKQQAQMEVQEV